MSSQSDRQKARQDTRNRKGEYSDMNLGDNRSEADISLGTQVPAGDTLDAALRRHGLTTNDVPGIEQAWADKFGVLDEPEVPTTTEYLNGILDNPDYGRHRGGPWLEVISENEYGQLDLEEGEFWSPGTSLQPGERLVISVHTRNGGGNREHYHDDDDAEFEEGCTACATERLQDHPRYLMDQDDSGDRTYANFAFTITDKQAAEYARVASKADLSNQQGTARAQLKAIEDGQIPPWRVLASDDEVDDFKAERFEVEKQQLSDWERSRIADEVESASAGLNVLTDPDNAKLERPVSYQDERGYWTKLDDARIRKISTEYTAAKADKDQVDAIRRSLSTLPPEVRDYLDGELPEQTLTYKEGRRTVTKKYHPDTDFQRREKNAARDFERADKKFTDTQKVMADALAKGQARLDADDKARARLDGEFVERDWALGWPSNAGPVPERPKD